jgi:hypothetical protein
MNCPAFDLRLTWLILFWSFSLNLLLAIAKHQITRKERIKFLRIEKYKPANRNLLILYSYSTLTLLFHFLNHSVFLNKKLDTSKIHFGYFFQTHCKNDQNANKSVNVMSLLFLQFQRYFILSIKH